MRHEHIVDGWWEMPGEPVPALGWPGTKNGASHRVWLPAAGAGDHRRAGRWGHRRFRVRRTARSPDQRSRRGDAGDLRQARVERATPHDLRRTHGSTITALGFGRDAMNRIQNHKEGGIAAFTTGTATPRRPSASWRRWRRSIMALAEERLDEKVVPIRR